MRLYWRRFRAHFFYLRKPFAEFLPTLLGLTCVVVVGGILFHIYYRDPEALAENAVAGNGPQLPLGRAIYITYCLVFMEHLLPFPEHWLLKALYILLPLVGLVFVLDAFVRFGSYILRPKDFDTDWVTAMSKTMNDHVILCGLGKLGLRVLQELIRLGEDVIVVERNPDCANLTFARKNDVPVRIGSHRQEGILADCNIAAAKSLILATDDDLANLEYALDARRAKPSIHVVLRLFDQELASKVRETFNIPLAFSTSALAAPLFALSSTDRSVINSFQIGDRMLVVARIVVQASSQLAGRTVGQLSPNHQIFFLSHQRAEATTFCPGESVELQAGDTITIQLEPAMLKQVHDWNTARVE